ncbi:MAG TPA: hypothetical protein VFZ76_13080 [Anaerolineales bacterium]
MQSKNTTAQIASLSNKLFGWRANWRLFQTSRKIAAKARPLSGKKPVVFFNASTRLTGLSLNAAFAYLAACGLQLAGVPVVYFACNAGMSRCVLGTDRDDHTNPPPCRGCTAQAGRLFSHTATVWFDYSQNNSLAHCLQDLNLDELACFKPSFSLNGRSSGDLAIPLGDLTLPSLRWALRRHHLKDDEANRFLLRQYLLSAYNLAREFDRFLDQVEPETAVIFNGIMYPEAVARWVAQNRGVRVVTHEVGFRPFSAFFTDGEATAYPISIPDDFELSETQNARLDEYLEKRFQGEFTMAGIRFWPEMRGLDENILGKLAGFKQIVPVFTNVIYDTSQVHANTVFPHMFAWLDLVLELVRDHPETLFVIRAHPDEMRPGTAKQSRESVQGWVQRNRVDALPNVIFIQPQEYISSYELIRQARFVMVYNSSVGLEATLMGAAVLCGGKARYTQYPTVFFPGTPEDYRRQAEAFLSGGGAVTSPPDFRRHARRFLYYQLFRASLPFDEFLENNPRPGFVQLRPFSSQQLSPGRSPTIKVLVDGILHATPFLLNEN